MTSRSNAGGRGGEAGANYRAGVAAFVAAHGMADTPLHLGAISTATPPTWIWLETTEAVDDLRIRFSDDSSWDVQAKRRCDWGTHFNATLKQWVVASRTQELGEVDRLILISAEMSGPLKALDDALRRARTDAGTPLLPQEARQYKRLVDRAAHEGWEADFATVAKHGALIELDVDPDGPMLVAAANLLDGTVVERGAGHAAIKALRGFFHEEGARSGSSGPEQWLAVLDAALIRPGPASAISEAGRARKMATLRANLGGRLDLVEVDHLHPGIPPLEVPDLLGSLYVELPDPEEPSKPETASLDDIVRRWARFSIIGLPGAGKTTAMEQMAAFLARDRDAPIPVLVRLVRLVPSLRSGERLTLEQIVRAGDGVPPDLVDELAERLRQGLGALLLDGMDECGDQQGRAVRWLRDVLPQIGVDSTVVVSGRHGASNAIAALGLPVTELDTPKSLAYDVLRLVDLVSSAAGRKDSEAARAWVKQSQDRYPDIWSIPLFAVLLATHAALAPSNLLPTTRAAALMGAVQDSVDRWEVLKASDARAWSQDLHPKMLIDGFATIGYLVLNNQATLAAVTDGLAVALQASWISEPLRAHAAATDIVEWWVYRVGAFTAEDDAVRPRVRMMAEIGDAFRAARLPASGQSDWLRSSLAHRRLHREPVLLAASLSPALASLLAEDAVEGPACLLAADAVIEGAQPATESLRRLVQKLADFAASPPVPDEQPQPDGIESLLIDLDRSRRATDGADWQYLVAMARMPLSDELRPIRDAVLNAISGERRLVATALSAASDCATDARGCTRREADTLQELLDLPIPAPRDRSPGPTRRGVYEIAPGPRILSERGTALASAFRLIEVPATKAEEIAGLLPHLSGGESDQLRRAMSDAGHGEIAGRRWSQMFSGTLTHLINDDHHDCRFILETAAALTDKPAERPARPWRLDAVSALFRELNMGHQQFRVVEHAVDRRPEVVRRLVGIATTCTGFSPEDISADAKRALELFAKDPLGLSVLLHRRAEPSRGPEPRPPANRTR